MTRAQIDDEASEWFVTLRQESSGPLTQERFMAWLRKSPEHVRAYLDILALWNDLPAIDPERTPDAQTLITRALADGNITSLASARRDTHETPSRWRLAVAACVATFAVLAAATAWFHFSSAGLYRTSIGEQRSLKLEDGSTVHLNSSSRIRVSFSDSGRDVHLLEGQALFHVARDAQRPFVVRSGTTSIRAVGTQFDVYRRQEGTIVTVVEGRVAVFESGTKPEAARSSEPGSASHSALPAFLSAGEQLELAVRAEPRQPVHADVAAVTAWTQGKLMFRSTPLSSVVDEFNRYNTRRLTLDPAAEDIPITAVFSSTDTQMLVEFLKSQPEFRVDADADGIRVHPASRK